MDFEEFSQKKSDLAIPFDRSVGGREPSAMVSRKRRDSSRRRRFWDPMD